MDELDELLEKREALTKTISKEEIDRLSQNAKRKIQENLNSTLEGLESDKIMYQQENVEKYSYYEHEIENAKSQALSEAEEQLKSVSVKMELYKKEKEAEISSVNKEIEARLSQTKENLSADSQQKEKELSKHAEKVEQANQLVEEAEKQYKKSQDEYELAVTEAFRKPYITETVDPSKKDEAKSNLDELIASRDELMQEHDSMQSELDELNEKINNIAKYIESGLVKDTSGEELKAVVGEVKGQEEPEKQTQGEFASKEQTQSDKAESASKEATQGDQAETASNEQTQGYQAITEENIDAIIDMLNSSDNSKQNVSSQEEKRQDILASLSFVVSKDGVKIISAKQKGSEELDIPMEDADAIISDEYWKELESKLGPERAELLKNNGDEMIISAIEEKYYRESKSDELAEDKYMHALTSYCKLIESKDKDDSALSINYDFSKTSFWSILTGKCTLTRDQLDYMKENAYNSREYTTNNMGILSKLQFKIMDAIEKASQKRLEAKLNREQEEQEEQENDDEDIVFESQNEFLDRLQESVKTQEQQENVVDERSYNAAKEEHDATSVKKQQETDRDER